MIIDCPACGAGLMFDPESGKMKCEACDSVFETYELQEDFEKRGQKELEREEKAEATATSGLKLAGGGVGAVVENAVEQSTPIRPAFNPEPAFNPNSDFDHPVFDHTDIYSQDDYNDNTDDEETMECNIYTCTSCGAEVAINNVEASTFCSFCGQPTVVFNRVASQKKPKYIIPFSVTKEHAISRIREKLNSGFFVPAAIKNFEIERVRGIYIPFWLYDIYYHDSQYLKGTVGSGKNSHTYYYFREADCEFVKLTLDASRQLNDESSQRLEPYYTKDMKDFSIEYLSGFYADTYDVNTSQLERLAVSRAGELFQGAVEKTIEAHDISVLKKDPDYKILRTEYAMFPAWFLTFRYEDVPYTLLVNGQTEKIIGGVPYDRTKVAVSFAIFATIFSIIAFFILTFLLVDIDLDEAIKLIVTCIILAVTGLGIGINNLKKVKESATLTSLSETNNFVKNRGQ